MLPHEKGSDQESFITHKTGVMGNWQLRLLAKWRNSGFIEVITTRGSIANYSDSLATKLYSKSETNVLWNKKQV